MYRKYDGIISPTEFLKKKYDDGLVGMKQAVIGNGVDTAIFHPAKKTEKNFNILYVGRLDPAKNITILLDALHLLHSQKKLKNQKIKTNLKIKQKHFKKNKVQKKTRQTSQ